MSERVQLSRKKGWRMPPNTVKVARPSQWGNPFVVGKPHPSCTPEEIAAGAEPLAREWCVETYGALARLGTFGDVSTLRGKNLACWCRLDQPCHADILLELANRPKEASDER
jgi:hypothetical protein